MALESGKQVLSPEYIDPLNDPNYADPSIDESLKKNQEVRKAIIKHVWNINTYDTHYTYMLSLYEYIIELCYLLKRLIYFRNLNYLWTITKSF